MKEMKRNPGDPAVDALSEADLARYYEKRAGDVRGLDPKPIIPPKRKGAKRSAVFQLRIAPEELELLTRLAGARGVSDFIRTAAVEKAGYLLAFQEKEEPTTRLFQLITALQEEAGRIHDRGPWTSGPEHAKEAARKR
jgi:hypothetical protein